MVYVPPGEFLMGNAIQDTNPRRTRNWPGDQTQIRGAFQGANPGCKVTLDAFWVYKNDVTVAQYRKYCDATGKEMPPAPGWGWKDDHPVVNVTWDEAKAYCDWAGVALPTEAQWEKAARGTDGRKYPWGKGWDPRKLQCSKKNGGDAVSTAPVGSFPAGASPYGCLDMAGNVLQWCEDWYDENYPKSTSPTNPIGPAAGLGRVLRGGSWEGNIEDFFRCAIRDYGNPGDGDDISGFRCVVREEC